MWKWKPAAEEVFFPSHLSSTCLTLWILCVCVFADTAHHLLLGFSEPVADPTKHLWGYEKNARLNFLHCYSVNFATECSIVLFTIFIVYPFQLLTIWVHGPKKKKKQLESFSTKDNKWEQWCLLFECGLIKFRLKCSQNNNDSVFWCMLMFKNQF